MAAPATPPESMPRRRWLRWLGYALGAGAALIAIAWLIVPPIARSQIETRLERCARAPDDGRVRRIQSLPAAPHGAQARDRGLPAGDTAADGRRAGRARVPGIDLASRAGARCAEGRAAERGARAQRRRTLQRAGPHRSGGGRSAWPPRPAVDQQHRDRAGHGDLRRRNCRAQARAHGARCRHTLRVDAALRCRHPRQAAGVRRPRRGEVRARRVDRTFCRTPRGHARLDAGRAAAARVCRLSAAQAALRPGQWQPDHPSRDRVRQQRLRRASARAARRRPARRAGGQAARRHAVAGRRADRGQARPGRRVRRGGEHRGRDDRCAEAGPEAPRRWHAGARASAARIGTGSGDGGIRHAGRPTRMDGVDRAAGRCARWIDPRGRDHRIPLRAGRCGARRDQRVDPPRRAGASEGRLRLRRPDRSIHGRGRCRTAPARRERPFCALEVLLGPALPLLQLRARRGRAEGLARLRVGVFVRRRESATDRWRSDGPGAATGAARQPRPVVARARARRTGNRRRRAGEQAGDRRDRKPRRRVAPGARSGRQPRDVAIPEDDGTARRRSVDAPGPKAGTRPRVDRFPGSRAAAAGADRGKGPQGQRERRHQRPRREVECRAARHGGRPRPLHVQRHAGQQSDRGQRDARRVGAFAGRAQALHRARGQRRAHRWPARREGAGDRRDARRRPDSRSLARRCHDRRLRRARPADVLRPRALAVPYARRASMSPASRFAPPSPGSRSPTSSRA